VFASGKLGGLSYVICMHLYKKKNRAGSVSIQVVTKDDARRRKIIKTIGVGRTPHEIEKLIKKGNDYINDMKGPILPGFSPDEDNIENFVNTIENTGIQVIGPELIFGTLYDKIGYDVLHNDMFRHLVICRLFNPGSKLKTVDYLLRYLHVTYSIDSIYRFMDNLCWPDRSVPSGLHNDVKAHVEAISFAHTKSVVGGEIAICFYDLTTLYFEAAEEDELRKYGFSKDGKHACPQIFIGLLVAAGGNPIGYDIFEGNSSESKTLIPMVRKLSDRFNLGKPIIVADSGLLTKKNMQELQEKGYQYILGARLKNETRSICKQILAMNLKDGEVKEIEKEKNVRLVVSCSEKRAKKDKNNRQRGLARLEKKIGSGKLTKQHINNRGYNKYLKLQGDVTVTIDIEKFNNDASWDGLKGYITNTTIPATDIINNYGNLWYIERAFRFNKSDLEVRPIYHRLRNRIDGHICICFTAYSILLELERLLKKEKSSLSVYRAQELTKNMYAINYQLPQSGVWKRCILKMTDEQQELYDIIRKFHN
jgi:hypothetical protein